jgi:ABC-type lipoprotein release transport system permease subunit
MLIKLAWRNVFRNKRRTFITLMMIQFAVVLATFLSALRFGIMDSQVENVVGGFKGYAAISDTGYVNDPIIDRAIPYNDSIKRFLINNKDIAAYSPRIIGGGSMDCGDRFKVVQVVGVYPDLEDSLTHLSKRIIKGRYLEGAGEVILGSAFAERLKADVDSIVFITGAGYHGNSAHLLLKVVGLVRLPNIQENKRTCYVTMEEATEGFATEDLVSNIALSFKNNSKATELVQQMKLEYTGRIGIYSWAEIDEPLFMLVVVNDAANVIVTGMLYFIISFGLFGTILMMLSERKKEFGVLISIGMSKKRLGFLVFLENVFMAFLGTLIGFLVAIPLVYYFYFFPIELAGAEAEGMIKNGFEPILRMSTDISIFIWQAAIVLFISLAFSLYPIIKIRSMNENKAMRS